MANLDGPVGFRPVRHKSGGVSGRMTEYTIASGLTENIYRGDLVKSTGTDTNITIAAAGDTMLGVFAGCQYTAADGRVVFSPYWPTGTVSADATALVYDDPNEVFEVQATTVATTNIGDLCDHAVGTGSATTGNSAAEVDGTTYATGTSLKVLRIANRPDNAYGADANVEVIIVTHEKEG